MSAIGPAIFEVNALYSSEEIQHSLEVGNAGGVRVSTSKNQAVRRIILMTVLPTARQLSENPYHDRLEGDVLVYTGAGREGDQSLAGVNKRISQQSDTPFPIYGFQSIGSRRDQSLGPKRWRFLGLMEYIRHYPESQIDSRKVPRKVWLFEFRVHFLPARIPVLDDAKLSDCTLSASRAVNRTFEDETLLADPLTSSLQGAAQFDPIELEGIRRRLLAKAPEMFEHVIKDLLLQSGYERVSVTKYSQDGGIDVNAYAGRAMWAIDNTLIQVQAKRWLHTVGRKEVAELRGSLEPFARGTIVTTSHYSRAAITEATATGKSPIVLVDGYALAAIVKNVGLKID